MQRSIAIVILSFVFPEVLSIIYRLKIPASIGKKQAIAILMEVDRKLVKFLQN